MSRVALGFMVFGAVFALVGIALAFAIQDKFLGVALVVIGAFLMFLPYTRPHVDE